EPCKAPGCPGLTPKSLSVKHAANDGFLLTKIRPPERSSAVLRVLIPYSYKNALFHLDPYPAFNQCRPRFPGTFYLLKLPVFSAPDRRSQRFIRVLLYGCLKTRLSVFLSVKDSGLLH